MTVGTEAAEALHIGMEAKISGTGRPLVLVPGGLTGWLSWEPLVERLEATRRVISTQLISVQYGLEGHKLPPDYSLRTESRALAATLDGLGLGEPTDLAAWSYGAAIALDYALDHAERVNTLTLIEPPAIWVLGGQAARGAEYQSLLALDRSIGDDISEGQLEQFARSVGLVPPGKSPAQLPQWPVWLRHRRSLLNTHAPLHHRDDPARLAAFRRPVLLVKGTGSAQFLHQIVDTLAARLPDATVVELPSGHAPQLVSADRFLEQVTSFQNEAHVPAVA
jgi:pimeloyl-ACP methyl ester carboxylesterase